LTCRFLDVSDLAAPEPLEAALEAIQVLDSGDFLHFHHRQFPRLLFEQLQRHGFEYEVRESGDENCDVFIWKEGDDVASVDAMEMAVTFSG